MDSLQSLDTALFRLVNVHCANPFFDWALPFFAWNRLFPPALVLLAIWLVWKGGVRGRLLVFFLALTFLVGNPLVVNTLKKLIDRPRPFAALANVRLLVGATDNPSMPSAHTANWFCATLVAFVYYRRSLWFMLPLALTVGFARVYLGAHYPGDVVAGALIGMAYAGLILKGSDAIWNFAGHRWFPLWWAKLPSMLSLSESSNASRVASRETGLRTGQPVSGNSGSSLDQHWLRLAYAIIGVGLLAHLLFLASGKLELSEDEAYQWLWSKHLALSYYSKPPLIAYTQFIGTAIWGDTQFGVRFFAPVLGALTSLLVVRFLAREASGFAACLSVLLATASPLLMVGATLLTIDCLSVLFWVAAMLSGWRAVRDDSSSAWLWTGLWMGLGFLSKYTALFQWICWAVFFVLWPPARAQLRRAGPYLALLINALCLLPVLIWNGQHHWITLEHLANRGGLDTRWQPTLRYFLEFVGSEAFLLNPICVVGMVWAGWAFWKARSRTLLLTYLFSMGAPLFLFYTAYTVRARVQPNWIAPAVLPLFAFTLVYWLGKWHQVKGLRISLAIGLALGWIVAIPLHDTRLIEKMTGWRLSWKLDPLTRVLGWKATAEAIGTARGDLLKEGKPVFIICSHYGTTSLISFYLPEAKAGVRDHPLVYCQSSAEPENQFYFWPGYRFRKGQNAIYVGRMDRTDSAYPERLGQEFASITDLGTREVLYKGRLYHWVHLFACRDLLPQVAKR
jgi:membrane-associated phospholipid phosphatase/4-amino-4-deoxy-L-arabinose transferase-like glycosyltransferase